MEKLGNIENNYLLFVQANFSRGTYECYSCHLKYIIKWLEKNGVQKADDITSAKIMTFIICEKNKGVSNSTINKRVGVLKRMLKYSNIDILEEVKKLKENKVSFKCLNNQQLSKLLNYIEYGGLAQKSKLILMLLLDTGCRLSELLNIKVSNIDFDNNCILLEDTKTGIDRFVRFTDKTKKYLKAELKCKKNTMLFDLKHSSVESLFSRIKKQLKFQNFSPHMLRHTHATILARNGASLFMIQDDLGHSNPKTTERYVHLTFEDNTKIYNNCMLY